MSDAINVLSPDFVSFSLDPSRTIIGICIIARALWARYRTTATQLYGRDGVVGIRVLLFLSGCFPKRGGIRRLVVNIVWIGCGIKARVATSERNQKGNEAKTLSHSSGIRSNRNRFKSTETKPWSMEWTQPSWESKFH